MNAPISNTCSESLSSSRRRATIRSSTRRSHNTHNLSKTIWLTNTPANHSGVASRPCSASRSRVLRGSILLAELSSSQKRLRFMCKACGFEFYFYSVFQTILFLVTFSCLLRSLYWVFLKCFHSIAVLNDSVFFYLRADAILMLNVYVWSWFVMFCKPSTSVFTVNHYTKQLFLIVLHHLTQAAHCLRHTIFITIMDFHKHKIWTVVLLE